MNYSEIVIDYQYGGLNPMQFGHEKCAPGHAFGPAVRTHWLLHYIVSGFGIYEYKGETYRVGPGEIFVIPPYLETYYEADEENPWNYIWIGFTTKEELPKVFDQPVIRCSGVGTLFEEMMLCKHLENGRSAFLAGCLWKLVSVLLEQGKAVTDYVDKALHYMHAEYANGITVAEIAERLNIDRCYFSALFSKRVGVSPKEYLVNLRVTKAADLMVSYGETPTTAALSVGYSDLYHFSKIFKKQFGVSPRAYIKQKDS